MDCEDCGQTFPKCGRPGSICFKCEKRGEVVAKSFKSESERESAMQQVEALRQCPSCAKVFKYLTTDRCGPCNNVGIKDSPQGAAAKGKSKVQPSPITKKTACDVIELDSSDSEVVETRIVLNDRINKNKAESNTIRLTTKPEGLPEKTKSYLTKKSQLYANVEAKKTTMVTFRCELYLQTVSGKRTGTRCPMQSRGFHSNEKMDTVFSKFVDMFNEPDAQWSSIYPDKPLTRHGRYAVIWTFKNTSALPKKWISDTVGYFWDKLSSTTADTYVKANDIKKRIITISLLVPYEITVSDDENELPHVTSSRKRKRSKTSRKVSVKREKLESDDFLPVVKNELRDSDSLYSTDEEDVKPKVAPLKIKVRMHRYIEYTKHVCDIHNCIDIEDNGTTSSGNLSLTAIQSTVMRRTFDLTNADNTLRYLARRLDASGNILTPDNETLVGNAELLRGEYLRTTLHSFCETAAMYKHIMNDITTPLLFRATVQNVAKGASKDVLICQPYVSPDTIIDPASSGETAKLLAALSHFSLQESNGDKLLASFIMTKGDSMQIFAPVTHSTTQDSGLGDGGPEAILKFRDLHKCNDICTALMLLSL